MSSATHKPDWQTARVPENTAIFAIGDIHGHAKMLSVILDEIEKNIKALPEGTTAQVIGIGDYIDRGESAPETIELLLNFKKRIGPDHKVETHWLCGNHDLCFKYILDATYVTEKTGGDTTNRGDNRHHLLLPDGGLPLCGFVDWMDSGGGISTIKNYCPNLKEGFLERCRKGGNLAEVNQVLQEVKKRIPASHKAFFDDVSEHTHLIVGDYLFTHHGVDPERTLEAQGFTHGKTIAPLDKFQMVQPENRNRFLWRDKLDHCPYVVVHGHTPSAITDKNSKDQMIAVIDPQKPYRLCIDTGIYHKEGALTCMMRYGKLTRFAAVASDDPTYASEYELNPHAMERARLQHMTKYPQYHDIIGGGQDYYGKRAIAR